MDSNLTDIEYQELRRAVSVLAPPGKEERAIECVREMVAIRTRLEVLQDRFGNLMIRFRKERGGQPLVFSAHLDHPGLVVVGVDGNEILAEYRGGSHSNCHVGSSVMLSGAHQSSIATITRVDAQTRTSPVLTLQCDDAIAEGDVGTVLSNPSFLACDDMAGVCACLHASDRVEESELPGPVRFVFTRAEEIGMVGAIGACRSGLIPAGSRVIAIDARRDSEDAAIQVSARDRSGPVNPQLIQECIRSGCSMNDSLPTTTEAGVYGAFGFDSAAVTYPILSMHNEMDGMPVAESMNPKTYEKLVATIRSLMLNTRHEPTRETLIQHFNRNISTIE